MGLSRRALTRLAAGGLVALAALAAHDGWQLGRAVRINAAIERGVPADAADDAGAAPEWRFAQACALAASGASEAALNRYAALHGASAIGRAARYNSANLLLREAIARRAGQQPGQALALVELAKENYRELLRADPGDWDARYNLERAQRLVPEPEADEDTPAAPRRGAERAATTMRGYSPGLP